MSLQDIQGNDDFVRLVRQGLIGERIAHAYLFTGPHGIGKRFAARQYAKFLNCNNPKIDEQGLVYDSCEVCAACQKIEKDNHPDVQWIVKEKDSASLKIEQIKGVQDFLARKPFEGIYKVVVIVQAEDMTLEAQNALLKTLEEPPADSVIILTVANLNSLVKTVTSRCQMFRFPKINPEHIKNILMNKYQTPDQQADTLASLSQGLMGKALAHQDKDFLDWRQKIIHAVTKAELFEGIDIDKMSREKQISLMDILESLYRDVLVYKMTQKKDMVVNKDCMYSIERMAFSQGTSELTDLLESIAHIRSCLDANANSKIAFAVLGGKIRRLRVVS